MICGSVDLISCSHSWLQYELLNIDPVQKRWVLDTSNLTIDEYGIAYHRLDEISRT